MKRHQLLVWLILCIGIVANAQNSDYKNGVGLHVRGVNSGLLSDPSDGINSLNTTLGIDLSYGRNLTPWLNVQVPVGVQLGLDDAFTDKLLGIHGDVLFQLGLFSEHKTVSPYVYLGPAFNLGRDTSGSLGEFNVTGRAGLGANFKVAEPLLINLHIGYGNSFKENDRGVLEAGLGLIYVFGGGSKKGINVKQLSKTDTDGDGIMDLYDDCPTVAGVAAFRGCPDTDNDGIADYEDKCPLDAGPASTMGCPDQDGDGVPDHLDRCPDIAGDINYHGCPFIDRDNDKVPDELDECPDTPGLVRYNGCPDTDGDGVPDHLDKCPDKVGTPEAMGCPDTDGDGIPDDEDKCPTRPGVPELGGCPAANQADINTINSASRGIVFVENQSTIPKAANTFLDQVVSMMKKNKNYKLNVLGYSDSNTPDEAIDSLAMTRAESVKSYLVKKGIDENRIVTVAKKKPIIVTRKVRFELL